MTWDKTANVGSKEFKCGYCNNIVATSDGYYDNRNPFVILICPHCSKPTYFDGNELTQTPGEIPGNSVNDLPNDLKALYDEARKTVSVGAYTSSVLSCRKLLMNIAVNQGAKPGDTFINYVQFLVDSGYVPPNGRGWVDHIRRKGNEATHEIALMKINDAEELITFTEMLLKFIYEFPNKIPKSPKSP